MKQNVLDTNSSAPTEQKNIFKLYTKKGWYGLPPVLLLLVMVVISCNRNSLIQTKLEPEVLSKHEQLAKKNEAFKDSLQKANEAKYWYMNPNNIWMKENARSVGAGMIRFKEHTKITPEELLSTHKEHLGYLIDDTFVEKRREKMRNPSGFEISYERYYKGILVVPEYLKIMIGEDGYVLGVNAKFKTDVDKIYKNPVITADEAFRNFKQHSGLFNKVNFEKGKEKIEVKLVFSHPVKTHGKNTRTGQIRWTMVSSPLKLFYHITLYLDQKQYIYTEAVGTNYGEVDPITGELINVYTSFSVW